MIEREQLLFYINNLLEIDNFRDYCPNGLQVEGKTQIKKLVSGVTACQALIEQAIALDADALLVHHGYFWKNEAYPITGLKKRRIAALLGHDINLLAYHLPLDAHPEYGNNACLGKLLQKTFNIETTGVLEAEPLVCLGAAESAIKPAYFTQQLETLLQRAPLHLSGGKQGFQKLAWCSGGAQGFMETVAQTGVDVYISGEVSEQTLHLAREYGVDYIAAGHHATERYGVQALGAHLAEKFELEHQFIEINNPV
ncbi:Nif3-like dinuclear metal center hexameric protein [Candidatus Venteria ishoeyi]|uniref:Putative GTP cyclohydrolase 1 type 2 n=1 Tax=Candidatus Venteria ishoeyi TaxID=1899563 RepID=A0A1H6FC70_9GAMM|nr:Nif3-like dinuclear metal center hexameric protein [Candidatus Venteria ishoeyi]MDM8546356.1 Nif3-like dinuclear metal center hexameric protein [Candidatus Venteria ishoeyi]SEH06919.1 Putative GTP cyclohydrolase 1 type 2 [Candidatus Venteria ishoeyi]